VAPGTEVGAVGNLPQQAQSNAQTTRARYPHKGPIWISDYRSMQCRPLPGELTPAAYAQQLTARTKTAKATTGL
jgi:hypothetical protein